MITQREIPLLLEATAYSTAGDKIGKVGQVFLDNQTHEPEFITVKTGLVFGKEHFVPLEGARLDGDRLVVPHDKDEIKDAPDVDPDAPGGGLTMEQETDLYQYYGHERSDLYDHLDQHSPDEVAEAGHQGGMTRSEEQLVATTTSEVTGTARLHKFIVTEQQTITVPVTHEEVRIVHEPITGAAGTPTEMGEDEQRVTLHGDRVVTGKRTVPVEQVHLETEQVTEQQTVSGTVRKEKIEAEGDVAGEGGRPGPV